MNFSYLNYGENFIDEIKKRELTEKTILVFSDYFFKNSYMKNREKNILVPEPTYLTLEEFQKKIFKTKRMILTEAKRPLTLFSVLDDELKELLKIESYYDIIDFADAFFKYYKELNLNLVDKLTGLQDWQEEFIGKYEKLKKKYDKYLLENELIPSDWIECKELYNTFEIEKFERIVFIDIPYFTPLMRESIKKLSKDYEIEIMVQAPKSDYNEELLKLEKVSLIKDEKDINIKIYENPDDMTEVLNLLATLNGSTKQGKRDLFSPQPERNNLHKIFPKYFISQKLKTLDDTLLYKFMKIENTLLLSLEPKKRMGIPCEELRKAIDSEIYRKVYNIDDDILYVFKKIFEEEYKYLDLEIFESKELDFFFKEDIDKINLNRAYKIFSRIYENLEEIKDYTTVSEFIDYIKRLGFNNFEEVNYVDILEKMQEAIGNIKSSEILCGNRGFKRLFKNDIGANLYTLLIKYMEGIEIREVERELDEAVAMIKNMSDVRLRAIELKNYTTYLIDITSKNLPGSFDDNLNFTENQRLENNLMTFEEKKILSKYRFIQGIFNSKRVVIFTKHSSEVERSVFLDELMIEYNLSIEENNPLSKESMFELLYSNLHSENYDEDEKEKDENKNINFFNLNKKMDDFKDNKLVVGAYDIINLNDCEYRFFLDKIADIHEESEENYGVSLRLLGIIVHKIFEKVSEKVYSKIREENNFSIDEDELDKLINLVLYENQMKIPTYANLYFRYVLFPRIKENVFKFYSSIEKEIDGKGVKIFWGEKGKSKKLEGIEGDLDVVVSLRADLIVETESGDKIIVDYKTGGKKSEQLDIYSIIMYGDENIAKKIIYNAIEGSFEPIENVKITKEGLTEIFNNFINNKTYVRARKNSSCIYCEYKNICKREEIL